MAVLQTHKVVAQLPAALEPNAIYFVRRSTGYDQFVTNGAGVVVAYPMNVRIPAAVPGYLADGSMLRLTMNPDGQLPAYTAGGATLNLQVLFNGGCTTDEVAERRKRLRQSPRVRRRRHGANCPRWHWRCNRCWRSHIPWAWERGSS
ncbi:hypothetical protein I5K67_08295 [Pseudomonas aeruginosa]|nr:hypothetical protein [Pseudomonas aeruginosa]